MEQHTFTDFIQRLTVELRNVACSVTNTLRGESFLKNIQPLTCKEDGGYMIWLEDMERYFKVVHVVEEEKCQAALLTTRGTVGQYLHRLISNNPQITWNELKNSIKEYYGFISNPEARLVELVNIKQGRTEGIQDYMQRVVRLAESAYVGLDGRNEVVAKQVQGFFIKGLRDRDIKMAVMKHEPQTLEAAYQKALSELKWKIRLDANSECEEEPMEICHSRRRVPIEAMSSAKSNSNNNNNNNGNRNKNNRKGSVKGTVYKTRERERNERVFRCWNCGREGHMAKFCRRAPGNGGGPFVRRPANGAKWYQRT